MFLHCCELLFSLNIQNDAQGPQEDALFLLAPPVQSFPLKEGIIFKQGDNYKSWKARHFVVHNEADNYRVEYFDQEGGKLKGFVEVYGYHPEDCNEEEQKEHPDEYGLKLVPLDDRKRVWRFKFASANERSEWQEVFDDVCYNSKPPISKDELIATAFANAYKATRSNYGYYDCHKMVGTEVATLSQFVNVLLHRELLIEIFAGLPPGPSKISAITSIKKQVDILACESVKASWNSCLASCEIMSSHLPSAIASSLPTVVEKEKEINLKITNAISSKVTPYLNDISSKVCIPLLSNISGHFTSAFVATLKGVYNQLNTKIDNNAFKIDTIDHSLDCCFREVDLLHAGGPLEVTMSVCADMRTSQSLSEIHRFFKEGFTVKDVSNLLAYRNKMLARSAICSFGKLIKEASDGLVSTQHKLLCTVFEDMLHDAKVLEQEVLCDVINKVLLHSTTTMVTNPCSEVIAPIQNVIDQFPGVSDFFNLASMSENIINGIVAKAVAALVEGNFDEAGEELSSVLNELGIPVSA